MALNSVNTNMGAMVALQNLNVTNRELDTVQSRINTGKKVATAKDNGAVWAIAQNQRATSTSLNSVKDSLARGQSIVDVATAAGENVSDLLVQMKEKALAASDTTLDTAAFTALQSDFAALRDQITKTVDNAEFNGANMIKASGSSIAAIANADGSSTIAVATQDLSLTGVGLTATSTFTTAASALTMVGTLKTAISGVSGKLAKLGTGAKSLEMHANFVSKLQDSLDAGVGNLVDADLAKESAKLQALQTKQQLGVQALSIANSNASSLLSLFR